jgi:ABC-type transporter Mla subunit MlaD
LPLLSGDIPISRTRNYVGLYEALTVARPRTREQLQQIAGDLAQLLAGDGRDGLQHTLKALPPLTRDLGVGMTALGGPTRTELLGTVRGAARTLSAVAAQERSIVPVLRGLAKTTAAFNTAGGAPLDRALKRMPATLSSLERGGAALRSALDRIDPLAHDLRPGMRRLGGTLMAARPLIDEARPALRQTAPLLADLRIALRSGARATPATRTLLTTLEPSLKILDDSLIPALNKKVATGAPAYLALISALAGAGGAFANFQSDAQGRIPPGMGSGHHVNFEGRFYAPYEPPDVSCSFVERVNKNLAKQILDLGACKP